ncbi:MAG TPA: hypothetical protein VGB54_05680 [Allosphingosinicella sp.]|jgi:hypothetical protein
MSHYRLLFFHGSELQRWEQIDAGGHLEALEEAGRRPSEGVMELWSDRGKVASFRPVGSVTAHQDTRFGPPPKQRGG